MPNYTSKENNCKNFSPNIFDKNKCQNCFKPRESHLLSDKDLTKAKPVFLGWLLLAPIGTDFDNPVHKSRKWQRRWFVLFEHGALLYALDDNQGTIPQGNINMNSCSDVVHADSITGQKNSLCIYLPDQKLFVRCEHKEEMLQWQEKLLVFPNTVKEEAKRKKKLKSRKSVEPAHAENTSVNETQRTRYASSSAALPNQHIESSWELPWHQNPAPIRRNLPGRGSDKRHNRGSSARPHRPVSYVDLLSSPVKETNSISEGNSIQETNNNIPDTKAIEPESPKVDPSYFSIDRKSRRKDTSSDTTSSPRSKQDSVSSVDSTNSSLDGKKHLKEQQADIFLKRNQAKKVDDEVKLRSTTEHVPATRVARDRPHSMYISTNNKENNDPGLTSPLEDDVIVNTAPSPKSDVEKYRGRSISRKPTNSKQGTQTKDSPRSAAFNARRAKSLDRHKYNSLQISPDLLNLKKGWLTKQSDGDKSKWTRHWFVLSDNNIKYYRDSAAEESGEVDGEINLQECLNVVEKDVYRNYGFEVHTAHNVYTLAAMTSGIRRNWMSTIQRASKHGDVAPDVTNVEKQKPKQEEDVVDAAPAITNHVSEDLSATERALVRRARIRERRKGGRSKTFDFAEFKNKVDEMHKLGEKVQISDNEERTFRRTRPGSMRRARHCTIDTTNSIKATENISSPTDEQQWETIEPDVAPSSMAKPTAIVKSLQSEVEHLRNQLERNNSERLLLINGNTAPVDLTSDTNDDPAALLIKYQQQQTEMESLKQELEHVNEKFHTQSKELRECSTQLDITLSEVQVHESRAQKTQNELQMEKRRSSELEKENNSRMNALQGQLVDRESQLKLSESKVLELQQKLRESERLFSLQNDHQSELSRLQESNEILSTETEEQDEKLSRMQELFEDKCQEVKELEEELTNSKEMIQSYEIQLEKLMKQKSSSDELFTLRQDMIKIEEELKVTHKNNISVNQAKQKMEAEYQVLEDCKHSLQDQLAVAKDSCGKLTAEVNKLRTNLDSKQNEIVTLNQKLAKINNKEISDKHTITELTTRLKNAEHQLQEYEKMQQAMAKKSKSSFKEKLSELEADMGDTGNMLAARLTALETPRKDDSDESTSSASSSLSELRRKSKQEDENIRWKNKAIQLQQELSQSQEDIQKRKSETDVKLSLVHECINELRNKINDTTSRQQIHDSYVSRLLTMVDSGLNDSIQILNAMKHRSRSASSSPSFTSDIKMKQSPTSPRHHSTSSSDDNEQKSAMHRLRTLIEKLKSTELSTIPQSPQERKLNNEEKNKICAMKLSLQALIIAEMATTLERTNKPISESTLKDFELKSTNDKSNLLRHTDTLAEKLLLQSRLTDKLYRLQQNYKQKHKIDSKSSETKNSKNVCTMGDMAVTHGHINYLLQIYNHRIGQLKRDKCNAEHKAELLHGKLKELVDACKSQQVETISRLAVEIDMGMELKPKLEDLPVWSQQADYGSLHGAPTTPIDLSFETSFFRTLANDMRSLNSDVISIVEIGSKMSELTSALTKLLQPSEIGIHASTIAYEAITQAELVFVCHRLRSDYESEILAMKQAMKEQNTYLSGLKQKRHEEQSSEDEKMKQLKFEHQQRVDKLLQQLQEVESRRVATSADMDSRLANLAQKQKNELEACNNRHNEKIKSLAEELSETKGKLNVTQSEYVQEIKNLKDKLLKIQEQQKREREQLKQDYDGKVDELTKKNKQNIENIKMKYDSTVSENKVENEKVCAELRSKHEAKSKEIREKYENQIKKIELKHRDEMDALVKDHNTKISETISEWKERLKTSQEKSDKLLDEEKNENLKELKIIQNNSVSLVEHNKKINQLTEDFEKQLEAKERQLAELKKDLTKQTRSEGDSVQSLKNELKQLENKLSTTEKQLRKTKEMCDTSVQDIKDSHLRQIDDLRTAHHEEIEQLRQEKRQEMEDDQDAIKLALDSMRKHHEQELASIQDNKLPKEEMTQLQEEIQTLSEHYSSKCVELNQSEKRIDELTDELSRVSRDCIALESRCRGLEEKLSNQVVSEGRAPDNMQTDDAYQLNLQLEVKTSEIGWLKQEVDSLKQQLELVNKKCKQAQSKHQHVFEELTVAKSLENKYKAEVERLRDQYGDNNSDPNVSKSKSQSNFHQQSPPAQISRNSSDRFIRSKSLKDGVRS